MRAPALNCQLMLPLVPPKVSVPAPVFSSVPLPVNVTAPWLTAAESAYCSVAPLAMTIEVDGTASFENVRLPALTVVAPV